MGLAEIIYPTDTVTGAERHFNHAAQSLFMALTKALWLLLKVILYFPEAQSSKIFSIGNLCCLYQSVSMDDLIHTLEKDLGLPKPDTTQADLAHDALAKIKSFLLLGEEGKASVISTFEKQLKLFTLPVVKKRNRSQQL